MRTALSVWPRSPTQEVHPPTSSAGGTAIFCSTATSFTAAALGADYVPGHADLTLDLQHETPKLRAWFERNFAGSPVRNRWSLQADNSLSQPSIDEFSLGPNGSRPLPRTADAVEKKASWKRWQAAHARRREDQRVALKSRSYMSDVADTCLKVLAHEIGTRVRFGDTSALPHDFLMLEGDFTRAVGRQRADRNLELVKYERADNDPIFRASYDRKLADLEAVMNDKLVRGKGLGVPRDVQVRLSRPDEYAPSDAFAHVEFEVVAASPLKLAQRLHAGIEHALRENPGQTSIHLPSPRGLEHPQSSPRALERVEAFLNRQIDRGAASPALCQYSVELRPASALPDSTSSPHAVEARFRLRSELSKRPVKSQLGEA